ncbi:MAG: hypothetical protein U0795_00625 [Pirellulales bacterium]
MKLADTLHRLFGAPSSKSTKPARPARRTRSHRLTLESLEKREVFSTDLLSAFAYGNEVGQTSPMDIAADAAGNSYVSGWFAGTVDFDPLAAHADNSDLLTALGFQDGFIAKYAPDDSLLWALRIGGDSALTSGGIAGDSANSIQVDTSGNLYVAGSFNSATADFGSQTLTPVGARDGFVMKLNSSGTVQWVNPLGGVNNDQGLGVGVDGSGNVYALNYRHDTDSAKWGIDVLKFSSNGTAQWVKSVNTGSSIADMSVDSAGNVFVAGFFSNTSRTVDFDPGPKTNNQLTGGLGQGSYVLKLNTQGNFGWVSVFKGQANSYSWASEVAVDSNGNVIVGGLYSGTVDFNPGTATKYVTGDGAYVTKLNRNGGLVWVKTMESTDSTGVSGLAVDSANNIYAVGSFTGTTDFDPSAGTAARTSAGSMDGYVLNLTSAGAFGWVETFDGTGEDRAMGVAVDGNQTVHVAGFFYGSVDFDSGPVSNVLTASNTYRSGYRLRLRRS